MNASQARFSSGYGQVQPWGRWKSEGFRKNGEMGKWENQFGKARVGRGERPCRG